MLEIKDEILEGEARYRIRDKDGNILFDDLIIEQITPAIQTPTDFNKSFLEKVVSLASKITKYHNGLIEYTYENDVPVKGVINLKTNAVNYELNQRVLLEIENEEHSFSENIIPQFSSGVTEIDGWKTSHYQLFDRDDTTYIRQDSNNAQLSITFPNTIAIKPTKVRVKVSAGGDADGDLLIQGTTLLRETIRVLGKNFEGTAEYDTTVSVSVDEYITSLKQNYDINYSTTEHYTLEITEGVYIMNTANIPIYLNVNGLGEKLITGDVLENRKKYEVVYDGTTFVAHLKDSY